VASNAAPARLYQERRPTTRQFSLRLWVRIVQTACPRNAPDIVLTGRIARIFLRWTSAQVPLRQERILQARCFEMLLEDSAVKWIAYSSILLRFAV
jgi:hypothetical protein